MESAYYGANLFYMIVIFGAVLITIILELCYRLIKKIAKR